MKRKNLVLLLVTLCTLSLLGVGFAAWVISAPGVDDATGNIKIDTVTDKRLSLEMTLVDEGAPNIVFGGPTTVDSSTWLTQDGDPRVVENLTVTYNCVVKRQNGDPFASVDDVDVKQPILTQPTDDGYAAAKAAYCFALGGDEGTGVTVSSKTLENENKEIHFTVTIEYVWGSIFGGINPYTFYNSQTKLVEDAPVLVTANDVCGQTVDGKANATWGDHAYYYLSLLEDVNQTSIFKLDVTVDYVGD